MASHDQTPVDTTILIVGAGIGGLTLALTLRKLNIPYLVLERTSVLTPQGAGISLAPNCLRALDQLGLLPAITENSQALERIDIWRERTQWKSLDFGLAEKWFGYKVRSIERHYFHNTLYEAAGGEEFVRMGAAVDDVIDDPSESWVMVKCTDGRTFRARMVVGADGIRSVTRRVLAKNAGMKATNSIRFTGRVHMSLYTEKLPLGKHCLGVANWMLYDDCILTTWPCQDNRQWLIGVKHVEKGPDPDRSVWKGATKDTVNDVYGNKFHPFGENGQVSNLVNKAERVIASNVFEEISFPSMYAGRVALLGDAAHSMTSFFGQGACQAIEDAVELANALQPLFGSGVSSAPQAAIFSSLSEYNRIRQSRAKDLVAFSANYARLHTATLPQPGWIGDWVRSAVYNVVPSWGWMWYLQWLYGSQPIVKALPH